MADISKYLDYNSKRILSYLKILLKERCLISAAFGIDEKDTFLTAIIEIDEKKQNLTIDCGPKEYLNKRLQSSAIIKFSTEYQGIKVRFEGRQVKKSGNPNQPSFIIPIPNSIYWLQRRQFYRVKSPLSKKSSCIVSFYQPETEEELTIELPLHDISASGFSLINESEEFSELFSPSSKFENCILKLENEEDQPISFEIKHTTLINPNKIQTGVYIGCYITDVTPRMESIIIRYMQNIDREIKQKEI